MAKSPKTKDSSSSKSGGGDNFTRWLVAGMVGLVVVVAVAFSLFSNRTNTAATLPSTVKQSDGYGISFNSGIKPVIDIWEDFQCPVCKNFEAVVGEYLNQLIVEKKANVIFHTLSFLGDESIHPAGAALAETFRHNFPPFCVSCASSWQFNCRILDKPSADRHSYRAPGKSPLPPL